MSPHPLTSQRGAATLAITLMLAFVVLLSVAFANRSMLFEAKTSANQYHAAQAYEAAEAGLDWALVQLNSNTPIGDDCLPNTGSAATLFRERSMAQMQAACLERDGGWSCRCPLTGEPPAADEAGVPTFVIRLAAAEQPGLLQLTSTGRSNGASGSRAQVHVLLGRLPGLDTLPAAALTVRGVPTFGAGTFGVYNTAPAGGGLTVHSSGAIDTAPLHLVSTPGTPATASVIADDPALAQLTAQGLFASMFRMDKAAWRTQPAVRELGCESACDAVLAQLVGSPVTQPLVWLRGGLRLDSATVLGSPEHPVLLVADGPVELHAGAVIHGVVYGTAASWTDTASAAVHGAVILEGDLQATGSTQIHHNNAVLQALHDRTGSYARVPGSWRDF
jgi:hypothetical protein